MAHLIPHRGLRQLLQALVLVGVALSTATTARGGTLEGQVFDRQGMPLPGITVQVVLRTSPSIFQAPREEKEVRRATTDSQGFFKLDLGSGTLPGRLVLRCHDPEHWDFVRYTPPPDRDITGRMNPQGRAIANCLVEDAPGWAGLFREIQRAGGPDTEKGKILRRLGMPPEKVALEGGGEEWRYPGAIFVFQGERLTATRQAGKPVPAAEKETR